MLVRDVYLGNYLERKLADFSMTWTMSPPCLDRSTAAGTLERTLEESSKFEETVDV